MPCNVRVSYMPPYRKSSTRERQKRKLRPIGEGGQTHAGVHGVQPLQQAAGRHQLGGENGVAGIVGQVVRVENVVLDVSFGRFRGVQIYGWSSNVHRDDGTEIPAGRRHLVRNAG